MPHLAQIFGYCLFAWLAAMAAIIAYACWKGEIPLQGILTTEGGDADPERVQSLFMTAFVLGALILGLPESISATHSRKFLRICCLFLPAATASIWAARSHGRRRGIPNVIEVRDAGR